MSKIQLDGVPKVKYNPNDFGHRGSLAIILTTLLEKAGFQYSGTKGEEVWIRTLENDPNVRIKVFTSIVPERENNKFIRRVRSNGKDAIRVCATSIQNGKEVGLVKTHRTNRTGTFYSIAERCLNKMREVYGLANKRRKWKQKN